MAKAKYEPLTLHDVQTLIHALAVAYEDADRRAHRNPQDMAACAMERGDYLKLFQRFKEQPDIATRPL